jgi:hypothetical protein
MTSFKLFERIESYCLNPSKRDTILRKYQSLQKYNTIYLSATCLSATCRYLSRFFQLTTANVVPEFQNQASKKMALQRKEGLEW